MLSPVIPVADAANRDSDLQLASTLMSPVRNVRGSIVVRERRVRESSYRCT
jgi:hypothetical protein